MFNETCKLDRQNGPYAHFTGIWPYVCFTSIWLFKVPRHYFLNILFTNSVFLRCFCCHNAHTWYLIAFHVRVFSSFVVVTTLSIWHFDGGLCDFSTIGRRSWVRTSFSADVHVVLTARLFTHPTKPYILFHRWHVKFTLSECLIDGN